MNNRQGDDEGCAEADLTFKGDAAAMCINRPFDDSQPQTCAFDAAHVARPVKHLEQMRLIFFRNADALIAHFDDDLLIVVGQFQPNCAARGRILDGV